MKRTYIKPVTESVLVDIAVPFAFSVNDEVGSGEQLSRELLDVDAEKPFMFSETLGIGF